MPVGLLVGYQIRCPSCKSLGIYAGNGWLEAGWMTTIWCGVVDETSDEIVERMVEHPRVVSNVDGLNCQGCGQRIVIQGNVITVAP